MSTRQSNRVTAIVSVRVTVKVRMRVRVKFSVRVRVIVIVKIRSELTAFTAMRQDQIRNEYHHRKASIEWRMDEE